MNHCDILVSLLREEKIGTMHTCSNINDSYNILLRYFVSSKISKKDIVMLDVNQYLFVHNAKEIFFITRGIAEYRINYLTK